MQTCKSFSASISFDISIDLYYLRSTLATGFSITHIYHATPEAIALTIVSQHFVDCRQCNATLSNCIFDCLTRKLQIRT